MDNGGFNPNFVKRVYPPKKDFGGPKNGMKGNSPDLDDMSKEDRAKMQSMKAKCPGQNLVRPNWEAMTLEPFLKDFNKLHEINKTRTLEEVNAWRSAQAITVNGTDVPFPHQEFKEANFSPVIMNQLAKQGFVTPTPIQAQGWPIALSGRDLLGIAMTGSGKTLAYMVLQFVLLFENELLLIEYQFITFNQTHKASRAHPHQQPATIVKR